MPHLSEGTLRRMLDEPAAVPDAKRDHVAGCERCRQAGQEVLSDARAASQLVGAISPAPDLDAAWRRMSRTLAARHAPAARRAPAERHAPEERLREPLLAWRLRRAAQRPSPALLAAAALVVVAAAGAAVLTTLVGPGPAKPGGSPTTERAALTDIEKVTGAGGSGVLGGFPTPSGEQQLPFGVLRWTSPGRAYHVPSEAAAAHASGLDLSLPGVLPAGVGSPTGFLVQPGVTATITFGSDAGPGRAGATLVISAGPAVLVEYGGSTEGLGLPALAVFTMRQPAVTSTGASKAMLEEFLLSRAALPDALGGEIDLARRLASGSSEHLDGGSITGVTIDGAPGLVASVASGVASGAVFESPDGLVHAAFGLLDSQDILGVAKQLG